jgi:hypothetical protein
MFMDVFLVVRDEAVFVESLVRVVVCAHAGVATRTSAARAAPIRPVQCISEPSASAHGSRLVEV